MNDPQHEEQNRIRLLGAIMSLPFVLAVPPVIGLYAGKWLDEYFGVVFFMPALLVLGFVAGVRECYRIIKKYGNGGI